MATLNELAALITQVRQGKAQTGQCDDGFHDDRVCRALECVLEWGAGLQEQVDQNTTNIALGGGGGGTGDTAQDCGDFRASDGIDLDLSGFSQCNSTSTFTVSISGNTGDNGAGPGSVIQGVVTFLCDGVVITGSTRSFTLSTPSPLGNNQDYSDSQTFTNWPVGDCTGTITTQVSSSGSLPGNGSLSVIGCVDSNCVT